MVIYMFCFVFFAWWCISIFYFFFYSKDLQHKSKFALPKSKSQSCSSTNVPSSKAPQVAPGTLSQQVVNNKLWKVRVEWQLWKCRIHVLDNGVSWYVSLPQVNYPDVVVTSPLESHYYAEISLKCKSWHCLLY